MEINANPPSSPKLFIVNDEPDSITDEMRDCGKEQQDNDRKRRFGRQFVTHNFNNCFYYFLIFLTACIPLSSVSNADDILEWQNERSKHLVRFPGNAAEGWRSEYTIQLLELALSHADKKYDLRPSDVVSPKTRNFVLLENGEGIDVIWSMTRIEREEKFLPVRIPIFKGLIGWRIPLIHKHNKDLFSSVNSLEQLRGYSLGQMHAWTDALILANNGFTVESGPTYESMFRMLSAKRFNYFPRSVIEALNEYKIHQENNIIIDPHITIYYPTAIYFFVKKDNIDLAADIRNGLEIALNDGSFDTLFYQHHGKNIAAANLRNRKIFRLSNIFLPDETPINRAELWLDPEYQ